MHLLPGGPEQLSQLNTGTPVHRAPPLGPQPPAPATALMQKWHHCHLLAPWPQSIDLRDSSFFLEPQSEAAGESEEVVRRSGWWGRWRRASSEDERKDCAFQRKASLPTLCARDDCPLHMAQWLPLLNQSQPDTPRLGVTHVIVIVRAR